MNFFFSFPCGQWGPWGLGLGFTIVLIFPTHPSTTLQAGTMVTFAMPKSTVAPARGGNTVVPHKLLFFCGRMGGAGHGDSYGKLSRWELPMLGSEMCCQERWLRPVTPCWRPPGVISSGTAPATQGWEKAKNQQHTIPLYSIPCSAAAGLRWAWEPFSPCSLKPCSLYQIPRNPFVDTTKII